MDFYNVSTGAHKVSIFATLCYQTSAAKNISYQSSAHSYFYYFSRKAVTTANAIPEDERIIGKNAKSPTNNKNEDSKNGNDVQNNSIQEEHQHQQHPHPQLLMNRPKVDLTSIYYRNAVYTNPLVVSHLMAGNELSIPMATITPGHTSAAVTPLTTSRSSISTGIGPSTPTQLLKSTSGNHIKISAAHTPQVPVLPFTHVVQPPDDTIDKILQERYQMTQRKKQQRIPTAGSGSMSEDNALRTRQSIDAKQGGTGMMSNKPIDNTGIDSTIQVPSVISGTSKVEDTIAAHDVSTDTPASARTKLRVNETAVHTLISEYVGRSDVIYAQRPLYILSPPSDYKWFYGNGVHPHIHDTEHSTGSSSLTLHLSICRRHWRLYNESSEGLLLKMIMHSNTNDGIGSNTYDVSKALYTEVNMCVL